MEGGNNIELVQQMPAQTKKSNIKELAEQATKKGKPTFARKNIDKLFGVKSK